MAAKSCYLITMNTRTTNKEIKNMTRKNWTITYTRSPKDGTLSGITEDMITFKTYAECEEFVTLINENTALDYSITEYSID